MNFEFCRSARKLLCPKCGKTAVCLQFSYAQCGNLAILMQL